jgi:hypothetical protein
MNIQRKMRYLRRRVSSVDFDDVLAAIGLVRRRNAIVAGVMGAVGLLVVGAAVGAGIGLLFAPASGKRTRETVEQRIASLREKIASSRAPMEQQQLP